MYRTTRIMRILRLEPRKIFLHLAAFDTILGFVVCGERDRRPRGPPIPLSFRFLVILFSFAVGVLGIQKYSEI